MNEQTQINQPLQVSFIREKFDVILVACLFLIAFIVLLANKNPDLIPTITNVCQAFIYALLALVGVRSGVRAIVGPVNTGTANINPTTPADSGEGTKSDD